MLNKILVEFQDCDDPEYEFNKIIKHAKLSIIDDKPYFDNPGINFLIDKGWTIEIHMCKSEVRFLFKDPDKLYSFDNIESALNYYI